MKIGNRLELSKSILWDVEPESIQIQEHKAWIIQRVLEYGEYEDWKSILGYYGLNVIVDVCKTLRTLDKCALSFICCISKTNKEDYRCYHTRQSNPTLWNS